MLVVKSESLSLKRESVLNTFRIQLERNDKYFFLLMVVPKKISSCKHCNAPRRYKFNQIKSSIKVTEFGNLEAKFSLCLILHRWSIKFSGTKNKIARNFCK